jgi:hypothetical protein
LQTDYLIVGQGLAGSVLAWQMMRRGKSIRVIAPEDKNSASSAAAGIFNPVTGRVMRKTWMAEELFNYIPDFYSGLEKKLGETLLFQLPVLRMFISQKQINDWYMQLERPGVRQFIDENSDNLPDHIETPLGSYALRKSGYVDVPRFIELFRGLLEKEELLIPEKFDYSKLQLQPHTKYNGLEIGKIIFCEGFQVINNPFFKYLPVKPNKGEILEIEIPGLSTGFIYNKTGFLMPRQGRRFWVGATYNRDTIDTDLSDAGQKSLEEKIANITSLKYSIIKPFVGVRPTVRDRRPLIGQHPEYEQIGIFNGLGSKGVSLGPYWAEKYLDFLESGEELHPEVNIARFNSLF